MAETASNMLPLGSLAPDFNLVDVRTNQFVSLHDIKSQHATVIMFLCNHCPYVKHIHAKLLDVINEYQTHGVSFVAICSNDAIKYPQDSKEAMAEQAAHYQYKFPYLYDETQNVARAYQAACTPDFYIFDKELHCVYRGRFDAATPGNNEAITGNDLVSALQQILKSQPIDIEQKPSLGCNIKWKK